MMGFIEPEQAEQAPSPMMMEQEQAAAAESEAAPREGEVVPEGTAEAETGGIVLVEELERQGPALTNKTLRKWAARWCGGDREGLPHISTWNTSRVSDMSKLFENQRVFNDDIGTWDTSGVTSMEWMFMGASSFNQPIGNWRVDKVTNMSSMFHGAKSFNQPLNDWRVDNVTTMHCMFLCARSFNQPLNDWRVDNVTSMGSMFYSASAFNQPLGDWQLRPDCNTCNMFGHPDYNICTNFQNSRPVKKGGLRLALSKAKKTSRETCCAIS